MSKNELTFIEALRNSRKAGIDSRNSIAGHEAAYNELYTAAYNFTEEQLKKERYRVMLDLARLDMDEAANVITAHIMYHKLDYYLMHADNPGALFVTMLDNRLKNMAQSAGRFSNETMLTDVEWSVIPGCDDHETCSEIREQLTDVMLRLKRCPSLNAFQAASFLVCTVLRGNDYGNKLFSKMIVENDLDPAIEQVLKDSARCLHIDADYFSDALFRNRKIPSSVSPDNGNKVLSHKITVAAGRVRSLIL